MRFAGSFLVGEVIMHSLGCAFACAHSTDNCGRSCSDVTTSVHSIKASFADFVYADGTVSGVALQTFGGALYDWVRCLADGDDDCVDVHSEFAAGDDFYSTSSFRIGLSEFHADAFHAFDPAAFVTVELQWSCKELAD